MTPDTTSSYYAAYTITAIVYIGYAFYIWRRAKGVREKLAARTADPSSPSLRSGSA